MRRVMKILCGTAVVSLGLLVTIGSCLEDPYVVPGGNDGNALLTQCRAYLWLLEQKHTGRNDQAEASYFRAAFYCHGLIMGILIMQTAYEAERPHMVPLFCPSQVPEQVARVIVRYLEMNPDKLHYVGTLLAVKALKDAFPCPPASTRPQR
jgi:hypothetical protein